MKNKSKALITGNLYIIHWEDTWGFNQWRDISEIEELAKNASGYIKTVGFYIRRFGNYETFSGSFNTNPEMCDWGMVTFIPKGTITKIQKLKE